MKNKRSVLLFMLPFFGSIPLVLIGVFEQDIAGNIGHDNWNILFISGFVIVFAMSILPFWKTFKGMFGSGMGSYNFFWGKGKQAQDVLTYGKSATATIISIGENSEGGSVKINGQPLLNLVLKISFGHGQPYQISFNTIINHSRLAEFHTGAQFSVKVDPLDNNNVVYNQQAIKAPNKPKIGGKNWTETDRMLIELSGIDAMAKLISLEDTVRMEDSKQMYTIVYEVSIPGKEIYSYSKEIPIPAESLNLMKSSVGKSFKAKVHPYDKEKITLDITT